MLCLYIHCLSCNIYIANLPLYVYDIHSHYCLFLCWILHWGWLKKAETCRMITICLYIIVSNYSAVVGICVCVCVSTKFVGVKICFLCCHPPQSSPCTKLLKFHYSRLHPFLWNIRNTNHYNLAQKHQNSINISGTFTIQFKIKYPGRPITDLQPHYESPINAMQLGKQKTEAFLLLTA